MKVKYLLGNKVQPRKKNGSKNDAQYVKGVHVTYEMGYPGYPVVNFDNLQVGLPEDLQQHVVLVIINDSCTGLMRKVGNYTHDGATGCVKNTYTERNNVTGCFIEVSAPTKEEALLLLNKIQKGDILPNIDYSVPQIERAHINIHVDFSSIVELPQKAVTYYNDRALPYVMGLRRKVVNRLNFTVLFGKIHL